MTAVILYFTPLHITAYNLIHTIYFSNLTVNCFILDPLICEDSSMCKETLGYRAKLMAPLNVDLGKPWIYNISATSATEIEIVFEDLNV